MLLPCCLLDPWPDSRIEKIKQNIQSSVCWQSCCLLLQNKCYRILDRFSYWSRMSCGCTLQWLPMEWRSNSTRSMLEGYISKVIARWIASPLSIPFASSNPTKELKIIGQVKMLDLGGDYMPPNILQLMFCIEDAKRRMHGVEAVHCSSFPEQR